VPEVLQLFNSARKTPHYSVCLRHRSFRGIVVAMCGCSLDSVLLLRWWKDLRSRESGCAHSGPKARHQETDNRSLYPFQSAYLVSLECNVESLNSRGSRFVSQESFHLISKVGLLSAADRSTRCRQIRCYIPLPWSRYPAQRHIYRVVFASVDHVPTSPTRLS
jgi:hypothetical protein